MRSMTDTPTQNHTLRIAALGDLHYTVDSADRWRPILAAISDAADAVLLCGDLTDYGKPEEARALARDVSTNVRVPVLAVLGNHDYESGANEEVAAILTGSGIHLLEDTPIEIRGVGFAGVKGFAGGFGPRALGPWGEPVIKAFVREAVDEALRLESALARLRTPVRVAVLHYSPIAATCEGEPLEIYAFLGCSRLEEPLLRYNVSAVFHGHAHRGVHEGRIGDQIPVYNVSFPLLHRLDQQRPFKVIELPASEG
jgi:Icc-related predicted phosphoesterase